MNPYHAKPQIIALLGVTDEEAQKIYDNAEIDYSECEQKFMEEQWLITAHVHGCKVNVQKLSRGLRYIWDICSGSPNPANH